MTRMRRVLPALLAFLLIPAAQAGQSTPRPSSNYVMNRLTTESMELLVAEPIERLTSGDVEGAQQIFDRMLAATRSAHGEESVNEADLLMSFGAMIHVEGEVTENPRLRALAGDYVGRSVQAYRAAFGSDHPEVATALNSHADILRRAAPDDPPAEADREMEEAYRIRLAVLGPGHAETIWTILYLADIRSAPARVRRNPALVDIAATDLERAAAFAQASGAEGEARLPAQIHIRRARLFARYGRGDDARRALTAAGNAFQGGDPVDACLMVAFAASDVEEMLAAAGQPSQSPVADDGSHCLEEPEPPAAPPSILQSAMATVFNSV